MRIITYTFDDDAPPTGAEAIARILVDVPAHGKRKAGEDWHPVIFTAPTAEAAHAKAEAWWNAELEKERARQEALVRAVEARKAKRDAA